MQESVIVFGHILIQQDGFTGKLCFDLFLPPVIRMVTLYYVVILSFLNHLNLNNGSDKTGSVVH